MADQEWRGRWWLLDKPDEVMPGTLIQRQQDGEVLLKLIGGFSNVVLVPVSRSDSAIVHEPEFIDEFPMILGNSAGLLWTLLQCNPLHSGGGIQDIRVMRALSGIHLTEPDQEVFDSAVLKIEYLLDWMRATTFKRTIELGNGNWTGKQSATTAPVDELAATYGGKDYTLSVVFNQFQVQDRPRANERSIANGEWAELTVASPRPIKFRDFDHMAKAIMDLMTLAAHAPAGVIQETLRFSSPDAHAAPEHRVSIDVDVMGRQIHHPKPGPNETARTEYLFTLDDIPFADVLPRWLDLHERTWLGCSTLFGLRYIPQGYTTARLLAVATAAEAMHRGLFPEAVRLPPKEFEAMRDRVMGAFKGKDDEAKATRAFLYDILYNEMRYKERLLALAAVPDQDAVRALISDVPKWAKYIKEQRNGMAHGDRDRLGSEEGGMVFDALEVTLALLGLVLLSKLAYRLKCSDGPCQRNIFI
jgi:ApeA N-terminal domain 1